MKSFDLESIARTRAARGNISLHSLALWLVLMAVAVPVTFVVIVKGKKWVTNWWAGQKAESVTSLIETGETQMAAGPLSQALAANPNDPKLLRMWDDLLKQGRAPASDRIANLRKLLETPDVTDEDRLRLAEAYAYAGDWNTSRSTLAALPQSVRESCAALTLEAGILNATGKKEEAKSIYRRASAADPANPEARRIVAVIDLQEPYEEVRQRAKETLFEIASRQDASGLSAMLNLAQSALLSASEALRLRDMTAARANLEPAQRLAILQGVVRAAPLEAEAIIAQQMSSFSGNLDRKVELYRWLLDLNRADLVIRQIQPAHAGAETSLFILLAEAFAKQQRWAELDDLLQNNVPATFPRSHLALLQADYDLRSGQTASGMRKLRMALGDAVAAGDANTIKRVTGLAETHQLWDIAVQAVSWLAEAAKENKLTYLDALYQRLQKTGNTRHMLVTAKKMVEQMPGNAELERRLSYLRLLSGQEMEMVAGETADMGQGATVDRLIEAMSAYRLGQADHITPPLSRISQWGDLTPGQRAIAAGLLKHSGQEIEALRVWEKVSAAEMLPEERQFVDRVVAGTL